VRSEASAAFTVCAVFMFMMAVNPVQQQFYLVPVAFAMFETEANRSACRRVVRRSAATPKDPSECDL
jgi:hypothetical protein